MGNFCSVLLLCVKFVCVNGEFVCVNVKVCLR